MIYQLDLEGNVISVFATLTEAAEANEIEATNIRAVIAGRRNTAGGFKWEERFEEIEEDTPKTDHTIEHEFGEDYVKFTGVLRDVEINTLEDLLKFTKVDLNLWEVKNYTTKVWTTTMKKRTLIDSGTAAPPIPGEGFKGKALYEHSALQVTNVGFTVNFIQKTSYKEKLLESLKTHVAALPTKAPKPRIGNPKYMVEYMITDHHLGKIGFNPATMQFNWSIDQAMQEYSNIVDFGIKKLNYDHVDVILLPVGNDLLNLDSSLGNTTSGTKVADSQFYLNLFRYAKEAVAMSVRKLVEFAPVKVIFVPGNHDETGVLALSEVIREMFQGNGNVEVSCNGNGREYHKFGTNFLAWHHGKGNNPQKAANMMISDRPEMFSDSKYRACHVGHTHTSKKTETVTLNTLEEGHGIIYEICPTVTSTDFWHDQNLFIGNLRRSKIFEYDYDDGLVSEHYYNLR